MSDEKNIINQDASQGGKLDPAMLETTLKYADELVPESLRPESMERKLAMMTAEEMDRREESPDIPENQAQFNYQPGVDEMTRLQQESVTKYNGQQADIQRAEKKELKRNNKKNNGKAKKKAYVYPLIIAAAAVLIFGLGFAIKLGRDRLGTDTTAPDDTVVTTNDNNDSGDDSGKDDNSLFKSKKDYDNYKKAYERLKSYKDYLENERYYETDIVYDGAIAEEAEEVTEAAAANETLATGDSMDKGDDAVDYTDTNVRTEGVYEADIIKTDGNYIYEYDHYTEHLNIYSVKDGQIESVGRENILEDDASFREMYINGDKLILMGEKYNSDWNKRETTIAIYDISNREDPEEERTIVQSGYYSTSRMVGNILYTFSVKQFDQDKLKKREYETYIPTVDGELVSNDDIFVQDETYCTAFTVITSVDVTSSEVVDSMGLMAGDDTLYVSSDNIYLTDRSWDWTSYSYNDESRILRISYNDGKLKSEATGTFPGYLNDDYSIDEYNGYVRLVTTYREDWVNYNGLYIYDMDMNKVSVIKNLAEGETIRSARFMGDTAYFVTFRNTDPLFAVDLSDPENPEIMDYLKIPGFSAYLHPYGENKLLGIGYDTDEWGWTNCVKLTMFDTTDPYNIKEESTKILYQYDSASVLEDRNAFMFNPNDMTFGFSVYGDRSYLFDEDSYYYYEDEEQMEQMKENIDPNKNGSYYMVFDYDEDKGFNIRMEEKLDMNGYMDYSSMDNTRGIVIGDYIYVDIAGENIISYDTTNYKRVDSLHD